MEELSVLASTGQPGSDRGLSIVEDPLSSGKVQSFSKGSQHHCDVMGRGFQPVQWDVASGCESGVTGLTAKGLNPFGLAMLAIANQRVDMRLNDSKVQALAVGTGKALGLHALWCSSAAFHLTPGTHRQWRWPSPQRGSGGESTGGAIVWRAWLEQTLQRGAHNSCL